MENIGIIIQKLSGGGAERVAANLSVELEKKYNVHLMIFDANNITYKYGGVLYDIHTPAKNGIINKIINFVKRVRKIRKIKKEKNIKCTISFMAGANFVNILSKSKDKIVVSTRNTMSAFGVNFISKCRERFLVNFSDIEITVSDTVKQDLIANFKINPKKLKTIYNFANLEFIKENCKEKILNDGVNFDKRYKYIITVGRLDEQKAQWHLIRVFKELVKDRRYQNTILLVLGQGNLEKKLKEMVKEYNIQDKVVFLGFVKNPHYYINKCDLFIFTSLFEGFSNSLVETVACGKPIISTRCGVELLAPDRELDMEIQDAYFGKYGIIIPEFDLENFDTISNLTNSEDVLFQTIKKVFSNEDILEYYSKKSLERAKDFSTENIVKDWIKIIEDKREKE